MRKVENVIFFGIGETNYPYCIWTLKVFDEDSYMVFIPLLMFVYQSKINFFLNQTFVFLGLPQCQYQLCNF